MSTTDEEGSELLRFSQIAVPGPWMPSQGTLRVAVEVAQALGRAEGAALFVDDGEGFFLHVFTGDASVDALEVSAGVAQSGRVTSGFVSAAGGDAVTGRRAFRAVPLFGETRIVGVLYLEGLADPSARIDALVQACARMIAGLLEPPLWLAGTEASAETSTRSAVSGREGR